jgi:hypothetical protein
VSTQVAKLHRLAAAGPDGLQPAMGQLAETLTATSLAGFVELVSPTLSPPDRAILTTDAGAHLFANLREGLAPGPEGAIEDELAMVATWRIELTGVRVPVRLWSGAQDTDTRRPMPAGSPA